MIRNPGLVGIREPLMKISLHSFRLIPAADQSTVTQVVVDESIRVRVAGSTIRFTGQAPYMEGNIVYVPIQVILEKLGYRVTWEAATNTLVVDMRDKKLRMPVNSATAMVYDSFIGAALGSEVTFDLAKRELNIFLPHMEDAPQ